MAYVLQAGAAGTSYTLVLVCTPFCFLLLCTPVPVRLWWREKNTPPYCSFAFVVLLGCRSGLRCCFVRGKETDYAVTATILFFWVSYPGTDFFLLFDF